MISYLSPEQYEEAVHAQEENIGDASDHCTCPLTGTYIILIEDRLGNQADTPVEQRAVARQSLVKAVEGLHWQKLLISSRI